MAVVDLPFRLLSAATTILMLANVAACSGGDGGRSTEDKPVVVPDVAGMLDVDAWYEIGQAGLESDFADPAQGRHVVVEGEDNYVVAQTPRAGTEAKPGDTVLLTFETRTADGEVVASAPGLPAADAVPGGLAERVQAAFSDTYGWPDEPALSAVLSFSDRDAPRVTVVTDLYDKAENEAEAMRICMTVASLGITVPDFTGVYVTAGEGGPFLAECDAVR